MRVCLLDVTGSHENNNNDTTIITDTNDKEFTVH